MMRTGKRHVSCAFHFSVRYKDTWKFAICKVLLLFILEIDFFQRHHSIFNRIYDRLHTVIEMQLDKDIANVGFDSFFAYNQLLRDFAVGATKRELS